MDAIFRRLVQKVKFPTFLCHVSSLLQKLRLHSESAELIVQDPHHARPEPDSPDQTTATTAAFAHIPELLYVCKLYIFLNPFCLLSNYGRPNVPSQDTAIAARACFFAAGKD